MKDPKIKSVSSTDNSSVSQKQSKATEEQIRYAKLSQSNPKEEAKMQEKIKEIQEITRKPADIIIIAFHDCNYDTSLTIQNIIEGRYEDDQGEWQTTNKKGKRPQIVSTTDTVNHTTDQTQKVNNNSEIVTDQDQKPSIKPTRLSRGGGNGRGRSSSRNWRTDDKTPTDEKFEPLHNRDGSRERNRSTNDRGRGRGRGRGVNRGGMSRGSRGGRAGFGTKGGPFRGSSRQQRGTNRGGFSRPNDNKKLENGDIEPTIEESWDVDTEAVSDKIEDWAEEAVTDPDWSSKGDWGDEPDAGAGTSLFSNDISWSQMNGKESSNWDESNSSLKDDRGKYLPENIDAAVIRSVPTSSTSGEVTSYQPTNDLGRYMTTASNQFPSSHQEGGLTSSLNDRAFSLPSSSASSDSVKRTVASMPMISGITESHKLEQEQLKPQHTSKPRKFQNKYVKLPKQPVVMPRSAQMVNDNKEQFAGLEFGIGPISPRKIEDNSSVVMPSSSVSRKETNMKTELKEASSRHVVASLQSEPLLLQSQPIIPSSPAKLDTKNVLSASKSDMPKTPPGFKPLDQQSSSRYMGSPGRTLNHMTPDPIPFPQSTSHTPPTNTSSLNVFSRNGGLGTSVTEIQSYQDQQVYDQREQNLNAEKVFAEQRALAEKQYLEEHHQRALSEHRERERFMAEQRAFQEQKTLAQQALLKSNDNPRSSDLTEKKSSSETRASLNDVSDNGKLQSSSESSYLSNKLHNNPATTSSSHVSHQSSYSVNATVSNEMLGLTSATGVQTTAKTQSSAGKVSSGPPGVLPPMNMYPGVQPGMIPAYQHQPVHGYNYDDLIQMQRLVSPYTYDVSMFQAAAAASAGASPNREGMQPYQGTDSKFTRGADDSSPVSIQQGSHHVAAAGMSAHQQAAYLNATGQIPYGYTYAYQPGVVPTGGVYPAFTTQSAIYQVTQGKGVGGNQYQSPYQAHAQQGGYNSNKFSGTEFNKGGYQAGLPQQGKAPQHNVSGNTIPSTAQPSQSTFKSQYNQDSKGFLGNSPTSQTANMHLHNQAAHLNHFLLQQPVGATHVGHHHHQQHVDPATHRSPVHQVQYNTSQAKRDTKASYQSYWSGNR